MIASQSKRPDLAAESDDQHEDHAARENQLLGWQGEIAREAQQGHGLDALQRALSELKVKFGADELFTFRAVDELQQCADRHLSELHYPETIHALFEAAFLDRDVDLDNAPVRLDVDTGIKRFADINADWDAHTPSAENSADYDRSDHVHSSNKGCSSIKGARKH